MSHRTLHPRQDLGNPRQASTRQASTRQASTRQASTRQAGPERQANLDPQSASATDTADGVTSGLASDPDLPRSKLWLVGAVVLLLAMGALVVVGLLGYPAVAGILRQSAVRASGVLARAEILSVTPTPTRINDERVIELRVKVHPLQGMPYEASVAQSFPRTESGDLRVGRGVSVKYDPRAPQSVVVVGTDASWPASSTERPETERTETERTETERTETERTETERTETEQTETERPETERDRVVEPPGQQEPRETSRPELRIPAGAHPECARTARCCWIVSGPAARSTCQTFVSTEITPSVCDTALAAYGKAASALGRDCR